MSQNAGPSKTKLSSSWNNPWITLTATLGIVFALVGLAIVMWNGPDVEAMQIREDRGQVLTGIGGILILAWVVLLGVRWEAERVLAAIRRASKNPSKQDSGGLC